MLLRLSTLALNSPPDVDRSQIVAEAPSNSGGEFNGCVRHLKLHVFFSNENETIFPIPYQLFPCILHVSSMNLNPMSFSQGNLPPKKKGASQNAFIFFLKVHGF